MPDTAIDAGTVVWLARLPDGCPALTLPAAPASLDDLTRRFFPCSLQRWLLELLEAAADDAPPAVSIYHADRGP